MAKRAKTKKTSARQADRPKRSKSAAKPAAAPSGPPTLPEGVQSEFAATEAGCLDQEVATALVFSCTGVGAVQPTTPLGTLFPSDVQRRGFCGCVFNKARLAGVDIQPSDIPCAAANTIADVIDRISC